MKTLLHTKKKAVSEGWFKKVGATSGAAGGAAEDEAKKKSEVDNSERL